MDRQGKAGHGSVRLGMERVRGLGFLPSPIAAVQNR
jgi:hypothetical protein